MEASESSRSRSKRVFEESSDGKDRRTGDDEDWEAEKRKHRSSKSRRHGTPEEAEEHDGGKRKSTGDKSDGRKKSGSLSHAGGEDEDDYEVRLESHSKMPRKNLDDRGEKRTGNGSRDREAEGGRRSRNDENEWNSSRNVSTRPSEHESSQSKMRNKVEGSDESEREKAEDKDSRYTERRESIREKGYTSRDEERNPPRRRWDELDTGRRDEESGHLEKTDPRSRKSADYDKRGPTSNRVPDLRNEAGEARSRMADLSGDKGVRSSNREESRADGERSKNSRGRPEAHDEDTRPTSAPREVRPDVIRDDKQRKIRERSPGFLEDMESNAHRYGGRMHSEKDEKHRQQRESGHGSRDDVESRERSVNMDEDGHARTRDRSSRDSRHDRRSRTPERSERHHRESDEHYRGFESDNERSISNKGKERDEGYRDDRSSRGREGSWAEKNRERDGPKEYWKRSQVRQDAKEGENKYEHHKEWDSQRREQERPDNEKLHGHPGYRRDGRGRPEGRSSSSYRNANETDSIEIKPSMNFDFGREEPGSSFPGRRNEVGSQQDFTVGVDDEEWGYPPEERSKMASSYVDDQQERYHDGGSPMDQTSGRNSLDSQSGKGRGPKGVMNSNRPGAGQSSSGAVQPPFSNNQGPGSFNRAPQQGPKGGRNARGGRGRPNGRDAQRVGIQMPPMMGPPFGHLALPPGPMQPLGPNMPHTPGPPIGPGVFIPPFPGPLVWPGPRGVDMNMLAAVPPNLPPLPPPGPAGPRFAPNVGSGPNHGIYFNQPSPGRGVPPNSGPLFNTGTPVGRGTQHDKAPGGWTPSRNSGPSGKAPSRGEQNDYSQNFVDTGARPQNFIRELELTSVVEDYPKLRELIQRKDEIVSKSASPPMYFKCDLKDHILSPEFFGTKFDVILVDPPWEEYVHRAPGVTDNIDCWTFEEIQNLKIEVIADTPSFIFLWVGDGVGLEQGRQCLKKWGFRRCEDICWVKTNKKTPTSALRHDSHTLFQHSKEHCLMGIKGTVRRSTDGHIIHANIDTDIIIAEEPLDASSTKKPDDMYRIIEHFALGRRRLELFGEDHNIRAGWLTVGKGLSSSNFNAEAYSRNFADKDGKVWQGGGGRNPPPDAPHLVLTTQEIEALRPKSPPPKNQQQQSATMLPGSSSNNRRSTANSPQNPSVPPLSGMNQDVSGSDPATPVPWPSPIGGLRWPDSGHGGPDDKFSDGYGFNVPFGQAVGDHIEFDPHRAVNML